MEDAEFYREEVRCGCRITEKTKKVWAVQLEMLDEVERICKKYGLTYFADSGTLIGAVRHKGYIPWDDDIDLVMLRGDYERFVKVAKKELKSPLVIQTAYTERNYLRGHAQIRNSLTTGCNAEDIQAGYNCGIFIDIFPLDAMPGRRGPAFLWAFRIKLFWMLLYTWYRFDYYKNPSAAGKALHLLGKILRVPMKRAYAVYERLCRRYEGRQTPLVCDTVFIRQLKKNTWKREWFSEALYLPFENRQIPVPIGYDGRLKCEYGNYMKPAKAPTVHGGIVLEPDIPYREYLKKIGAWK